MSFWTDIYKEIPVAGVAKERIEFLQAKFTDLEKENATFKEKITNLETENDILKKRVANLEQENNRLQEQLRIHAESENLDQNAQQLLGIIFQRGGQFTSQDFAEDLNLPQNEIEYTFNILLIHKFIKQIGNARLQAVTFHEITQKGREYIVKNKLS